MYLFQNAINIKVIKQLFLAVINARSKVFALNKLFLCNFITVILLLTNVTLATDPSLALIKNFPTSFPLFNNDQNNEITGNIELNNNEQGIIVSGVVNNITPNWPTSIDEMSLKDHIEIWLTDLNEIQLPPIGWGNQYGYNEVNKEADCLTIFPFAEHQGVNNQEMTTKQDKCKHWYQEQLVYRQSFKKLFLRHWQLAPNMAREIYAVPAFQLLEKNIQTKLAILEPIELPKIKFMTENITNTGYKFQVLIPWNLFPPMQSLLSFRCKEIRIE